MGSCGIYQKASTVPPLMSHGLCPYFYNSAFKNDFKSKNNTGCSTSKAALKIPVDFKMGYMEMRRKYERFNQLNINLTKSYLSFQFFNHWRNICNHWQDKTMECIIIIFYARNKTLNKYLNYHKPLNVLSELC